MNLRDKFLWNFGILFAFLALAWNTWNLYNMNAISADSLSKFKNEQVGTDNELEKKVAELEKIYLDRDVMKFILGDNPVDLNRVISVDGIYNSKRRKNLWVSGIIDRNDNTPPMALINYKDKIFNVIKGDSIAGGIILNITTTEVVFKKNEKLHTYNLGLNNNFE